MRDTTSLGTPNETAKGLSLFLDMLQLRIKPASRFAIAVAWLPPRETAREPNRYVGAYFMKRNEQPVDKPCVRCVFAVERRTQHVVRCDYQVIADSGKIRP